MSERKRAVYIVYVDLDPVPGEFHSKESAHHALKNILRVSIGHYNPMVSIAPDKLQAASWQGVLDFAKQYDLENKYRAFQKAIDEVVADGHEKGAVMAHLQASYDAALTSLKSTPVETHYWPVPVGMAGRDVVVDKRYGAMIQASPAAVHSWLVTRMVEVVTDGTPVEAIDRYEVVIGETRETVSARGYLRKQSRTKADWEALGKHEGVCDSTETYDGKPCVLRKGHKQTNLGSPTCSSGIMPGKDRL